MNEPPIIISHPGTYAYSSFKPEESAKIATKHYYNSKGFTLADLDEIMELVQQNPQPFDALQWSLDNNPWFRQEVDKYFKGYFQKLQRERIHFEVKRSQDRKRIKRKRLHQK